MVIVYQSHTGFTKEYAQMLGKAEKMKTYTLAEAERQLLSDAQVFYICLLYTSPSPRDA